MIRSPPAIFKIMLKDYRRIDKKEAVWLDVSRDVDESGNINPLFIILLKCSLLFPTCSVDLVRQRVVLLCKLCCLGRYDTELTKLTMIVEME